MFEKDIKEKAEKRCSKYFQENCYKENRWADTHDLVAMYLAGYNKANEWHDLRKDPTDLPKEKVDVYVLYLWGEVDVQHLAWNKEWWGKGTHCSLTDVIAWKEIVLPKESE